MRTSVKMMALAMAGMAGATFAPSAAQAQLFYGEPTYESGPIEPGDPLIGIELPGATPAEARAGLIWNLRAGLNVAALRCQFSKYLRTVDVYNAVLDHHSAELASAYSTLEGYFRRRAANARAGQRAFDEWNTSTYNNYSTQNGQGFCQTASNIGKEALARPKGSFLDLARERMRLLRNSAVHAYVDRIYPAASSLRPLPASLFAGCAGLSGRQLQQCQTQQSAAR